MQQQQKSNGDNSVAVCDNNGGEDCIMCMIMYIHIQVVVHTQRHSTLEYCTIL
jgi:hypothetical protein